MRQIKSLCRAKKFDKALARLEKILERHKECPHLWNLRGDLIQLLDAQDGPALSEAAESYKTALRLNPSDLEALENLAHFYDAVDPKPARAKYYAQAYIARARAKLADMERVVSDEA